MLARRIRRALFDKSIADTWATCPVCGLVLPAEAKAEAGAVWLSAVCPTHGPQQSLQSRHPRLYRGLELFLPPAPTPSASQPIAAERERIRGVFIDLTERCNLSCPNCLTDASLTADVPAPTLSDAMAALARLLPQKPVVYLTGGEPTLRDDLFTWIETLSGHGYDVKLLTNGLRLRNRGYCADLARTGVRWVLLQFDSLDDDALSALRGQPGLAAIRGQVLANLSDLGMNIDLACMIDRNHNLGDMGELLRLGFAIPGVRHVSFMPSRRLGRGLLTDDDNLLDEVEMMAAVAEQTEGAIRPRDWLAFFAAAALLHRVTKSVDLAPRRCFLPLPLVGTAARFRPLSRPSGWLTNPRNVHAVGRMLARGGRLEAAPWTERTLLTSIETFREPGTIDLGDAARCTRYYLVGDRVQKACLHNVVDRPARGSGRSPWPAEMSLP